MKGLLLTNLIIVFLHFTFANLNYIMKQIKDEVASHPRLTFYIYQDKYSDPKVTFVIRNLMHRIPSVLVDVKEISKNVSFGSEGDPYNNPMMAKMHIILLEEIRIDIFFRKMNDVLSYIQRTLFYGRRTKCLLILFFKKNSSALYRIDHYLSKVFASHNFVDFTILEVRFENLTIAYHNPFLNKVFRNNYLSSKAKIFPDKMKNLYGFNLKIGSSFKKISNITKAAVEYLKNSLNATSSIIIMKYESNISMTDLIKKHKLHFTGNYGSNVGPPISLIHAFILYQEQ